MEGKLTKLLLFFFTFLFTTTLFAQDLTGIWRGYFITESGENYKLEFQLKLNPTKSSTGVSYSYLDVRFYGKATMTGFFNKSEKELSIQEIKTVEVRNIGGGSTCIMNYKLKFAQSGKEEFLEGTYIGKQENVKTAVWGDCGGGKVFLRRVTTSDFYLEPFLKGKIQPKTEDTTAKVPPITKAPVKKPQVAKTVPGKTIVKTPTKPVQNKTVQRKTTVIPKTDSVKAPKVDVVTPQRPIVKPVIVPAQTRDRENNVIKTIEVDATEITIKIYDNGEVDDDTVSVYLDNKLVIASQRISSKPLTYKFQLNESEPEHIVTMVADNLGRIPPNTSLMIVNAGDKRYEVFISTNEQKNAVIRFRYKKTE